MKKPWSSLLKVRLGVASLSASLRCSQKSRIATLLRASSNPSRYHPPNSSPILPLSDRRTEEERTRVQSRPVWLSQVTSISRADALLTMLSSSRCLRPSETLFIASKCSAKPALDLHLQIISQMPLVRLSSAGSVNQTSETCARNLKFSNYSSFKRRNHREVRIWTQVRIWSLMQARLCLNWIEI